MVTITQGDGFNFANFNNCKIKLKLIDVSDALRSDPLRLCSTIKKNMLAFMYKTVTKFLNFTFEE